MSALALPSVVGGDGSDVVGSEGDEAEIVAAACCVIMSLAAAAAAVAAVRPRFDYHNRAFLQGFIIRPFPGFVNFVPAVAYQQPQLACSILATWEWPYNLKCCCTEQRSLFVFVRLFEGIGHWMHQRNNHRLLVARTNEYGR